MDYQCEATVNIDDLDNAESNGIHIRFGDEKPYALCSDVIYHEYTHNIVYHLYSGWIGSGYVSEAIAMNEGIPDYFAATLNDDSRIGADVDLPSYRNLDNEKTMDDYSTYQDEETKYWNSVIISGALWDMRETGSIGAALADELIFFAIDRTPNDFEGVLDEILTEDDTDADLSNGTPHIDAILYAFENHLIYTSNPDVPPAATTNLTLSSSNYHPRLDWDENTEPDLENYNVQRKVDSGSWTTIANPTITYYIDEDVWVDCPQHDIYYKVRAKDDEDNYSNFSNTCYVNGLYTGKPLIVDNENIPTSFSISNYPNPFNPVTNITYDVPNESRVKIEMYNVLGQEVAELVHKMHNPGRYSINFDASNLSAGIYIVHMTAFNDDGDLIVKNNKITLLK